MTGVKIVVFNSTERTSVWLSGETLLRWLTLCYNNLLQAFVKCAPQDWFLKQLRQCVLRLCPSSVQRATDSDLEEWAVWWRTLRPHPTLSLKISFYVSKKSLGLRWNVWIQNWFKVWDSSFLNQNFHLHCFLPSHLSFKLMQCRLETEMQAKHLEHTWPVQSSLIDIFFLLISYSWRDFSPAMV